MFKMELISQLPQHQEYFDLERINEFIKKQRENIMMYYDYFLNIDVSVYQKKPKEKGLLEIMALRVDSIRKILAILLF